MTFTPFYENLMEFNRLKDKVKSLSMIYQLDAKQDAARAFNKPIDFYYHFSYVDWCAVSEKLVKKRSKVMQECNKLGIPADMPYCNFPHYRKEMGLDR